MKCSFNIRAALAHNHLKHGLVAKTTLRAAAFNLFNRHRLGGIDTNLDSSTFGMITNPQVNNPREIQFGLKLYF